MFAPGHRLRIIVTSIIMVVICFGIYGIVLQSDSLSESAASLRSANPLLVLAAIVSIGVSYAASTSVYVALALRRLTFLNTFLLQLSNLLINRVLPSGVGAVGMNYLYLRTAKHRPAEAGLVIVANNLIGFFGHMLLLACLGVLAIIGVVTMPTITVPSFKPEYGSGFVVVAGVVVVLLIVFRKRIHGALRSFKQAFTRVRKQYARHPLRLLSAFGLAWTITITQAITLWFSCLAVGVDVSVLSAFVIFTFGIFALAVTPLPGGLGGVEAALVTGLVSIGIDPQAALAAVLLYRFVTFWLGLAIGAVALRFVASRRLVMLHKH